jgi:hypothetical protein
MLEDTMATRRDQAFEAFYESLPDAGGIGGREIMRRAWEAGRRYEIDRLDALTRRRLLTENRGGHDGTDDDR